MLAGTKSLDADMLLPIYIVSVVIKQSALIIGWRITVQLVSSLIKLDLIKQKYVDDCTQVVKQ